MNIGAVARQAGIEVATLRKWEARYGFPVPLRSEGGRREYSTDTVDQLLAIRRCMAAGQRPGKVIQALLSNGGRVSAHRNSGASSFGISLLLGADFFSFQEWLLGQRRHMTAVNFVEHVAAPMAREVGDLWARGELPVFAEHVFFEELQRVLRLVHDEDRTVSTQPRILLTALAGEKHTSGLLMVRAVLAAHGEAAICMTGDLPVTEILAAAAHYRVSVVGLTASTSYPPKLLLASLRELRHELPARIQLWAGGAGVVRLPKIPQNIIQISNMFALQVCLKNIPDSADPFSVGQLS